MTYIAATATNFPANYYSQEVLANALYKFCAAADLDFDLEQIYRFFNSVQIEGRYFTLPLEPIFDQKPSPEATARASIEAALNLFEGAVTTVLEHANLAPEQVSVLSSVTLLAAVPPLETRLMNRIPFSPQIKRLPLFGYGCAGGTVGLARVADYLRGYPQEAAVLMVGEISSALWRGSLQLDLFTMIKQLPETPELYSDIISTIVTAALFADGTTAVLLVGDDHPLAQSGGPRVVDSCSLILPNTVDLMGMEVADIGFRNILKAEVSEFAAIGVHKVVHQLLEKHQLAIDDIDRWIIHPGGPKVIKTIQSEFALTDEQVQLSWNTLAKIGNISSGTVIYMLNELMQQQVPAGSYGLMIGMGPGFAQEAVLLQW
jgi:alkylresorcinol/alkylpyrone synthase